MVVTSVITRVAKAQFPTYSLGVSTLVGILCNGPFTDASNEVGADASNSQEHPPRARAFSSSPAVYRANEDDDDADDDSDFRSAQASPDSSMSDLSEVTLFTGKPFLLDENYFAAESVHWCKISRTFSKLTVDRPSPTHSLSDQCVIDESTDDLQRLTSSTEDFDLVELDREELKSEGDASEVQTSTATSPEAEALKLSLLASCIAEATPSTN